MNILFIVDSSASTNNYLELYSRTVNEIVNTYRNVPNINLSFYTFSYGFTRWFRNYNFYDLKGIGYIKLNPDGMTALYDSLSLILQDVDDRPRLVIILTDGDDNCSGLVTCKRVRDNLTCLKERGWKFLFLGVNKTSMEVGNYIGCDLCVMYSPVEKCFNGIVNLIQSITYGHSVTEKNIDLTSMADALDSL
jgi:hypothetical protein